MDSLKHGRLRRERLDPVQAGPDVTDRHLKLAVQGALLVMSMGVMVMGARADSDRPTSRIAQQSLIVKEPMVVEPNLMFTLDDSGSMAYNFLPDQELNWRALAFHPDEPEKYYYYQEGLVATTDPGPDHGIIAARRRSHSINKLYYNPEVRYLPWVDENGKNMPDADPGAAYFRLGYVTDDAEESDVASTVVNLRGEIPVGSRHKVCHSIRRLYTSDKDPSVKGTEACEGVSGVRTIKPATYYEYSGPKDPTEQQKNNPAFYKRVSIMDHTSFQRGEERKDCTRNPVVTPGVITHTCTREQEYRNFANWYQYHRTRMHAAIASVGQAFAPLGEDYRIGYGRINSKKKKVDGVDSEVIERGVRRFSGESRKEFFRWLNKSRPYGYTPLLNATDMVGKYFERKDNRGPWAHTPGKKSDRKHLSCRRSFHLLMTDGAYNFATDEERNKFDLESDNVRGEVIAGLDGKRYQYQPNDPLYASATRGTLADYAMHYWKRDLRPDLQNDVVVDPGNPAFWQHVAMYSLGFGVSGSLKVPDDLPLIQAGTKSWPSNIPDTSPQAVDDLWHAAINGRGRYVNVTDSSGFLSAVEEILREIQGRTGSTAGIAVNSQALQAGNQKYVPSFTTRDWTGNLIAYQVDATGRQGDKLWEAAEKVPTAAKRRLFVGNGGSGAVRTAPFLWDQGLPVRLKEAMVQQAGVDDSKGSQLINYLRGDRAEEGGLFRRRKTVMGHIVNSPPVYIGSTFNHGYQFLPASLNGQETGAGSYVKYVKDTKPARAARPGVVFIGSNDGVLHAFDSNTGAEVFGYIPAIVAKEMARSARQDFKPRYLMDGPLIESDAFLSGKWRNVLVGTTGAGPRAVFALDVTDTRAGLNEKALLWEMDGDLQAELGHVLSAPEVGVMRDGRWVVVFGNGYESRSNQAQLFIVDLATGELIRRINTNVGSEDRPNGLGGVRLLRDGNNVIAAAYAGDLHGNVWKFDLTSEQSSQWKVAFDREPLFTLKDPDTRKVQPVTAPPATVTHPAGGVMLLIGTGKLFDDGDDKISDRQALYGLWDESRLQRNADGDWAWTAGSRIEDEAKILTREVSISDGQYARINAAKKGTASAPVDWRQHRGWRIPLTMIEKLNSKYKGQRNISQPLLVSGLALFETMTPVLSTEEADNACVTRIRTPAFNVLVDPLSGLMTTKGVIDTNKDGKVTTADKAVGGWQVDDWNGRSVVLWEPPQLPQPPCQGSNCVQQPKKESACPPNTLRSVLQNVGAGVTMCVSVPGPSRWWWRELSVPDRKYDSGAEVKPEKSTSGS